MILDPDSTGVTHPGRFRAELRDQPWLPYERLGDSDRSDQKNEAIRIMEDGWIFADFPQIPVVAPIEWDSVAAANRSWEFRLHCWDFLGPALCVLDKEADERLLFHVVDVANDWSRKHPSSNVPSRMAWYDMAVGLRAHRLAFILDLAARSETIPDRTLQSLLACVQVHQEVLSRDDIFKPHSNHGLYVAAGQKALGVRLSLLSGMEEQRLQADARLRKMFEVQFTAEGVHREHSPDYHRMILSTIRQLHRADLVPDDAPIDIETIESALAWFVLPDRTLAMFGDTPLRVIPNRKTYQSPLLQLVSSGGGSGRPIVDTWRAFPESGYAVYRSGWPCSSNEAADWSYLAFNAAFHSRTHKHADDLSFIWYDRKSQILIDPGRFGYLDPTDPDSDLGQKGFYYAHPSRVYVEETRAHNAVEIDGQSYQRRGVTPYGSALRRTGERGDVFYTEAHAEHLTLDRSYRIQHTRILLLRAREFLIVYDRLWDPRNRPHQFRQWFQFAPHLDAIPDDIGWTINGPNDWRLWGVPLLDGTRSQVIRGETEPELQGWISYRDNELEATPSVCVSHTGVSASFATLFCFSDVPPTPGHSSVSDYDLKFGWQTSRQWNLTVDLDNTNVISPELVIGGIS